MAPTRNFERLILSTIILIHLRVCAGDKSGRLESIVRRRNQLGNKLQESAYYNRRGTDRLPESKISPRAPGCDGKPKVITDPSGELTTPDFPSSYPHNQNCIWHITAPRFERIRLTISSWALEAQETCMYDWFSVENGGMTHGPYCGINREPLVINSMSENLTLTFTSDFSVTAQGFSAQWTFVSTDGGAMKPEPGCGGTPAILNKEEGEFTSPGYALSMYPHSASCSWKIKTPGNNQRAHVRFETFQLEGEGMCRFDRLVIYDGPDETSPVLGRFCGNASPGGLTATDRYMFISFVSDESVSAQGFKAQYSAKNNDLMPGPGSCGMPEMASALSRIVGGDEAVPGSWPWQIRMLSRSRNWGHYCGGSLLDNSWVVTAAHCVYGQTKDDFRVVVGDHLGSAQDTYEETIPLKRLIVHEDYSPTTFENDIALFELERPATWSRAVQPICLPNIDATPMTLCVATGWGDTRETGSNDALRQVYLPIIEQAQCMQWYNEEDVAVEDAMLCAGFPEGLKDSCQGDSGGPFVCKTAGGPYVLQGVTSFGIDCALAKRPGVYTRITRFIEWISRHSGVGN